MTYPRIREQIDKFNGTVLKPYWLDGRNNALGKLQNSSLLGENVKDAASYGWEVPEMVQHNWETMVGNVQAHVKSLNFGYRAELMTNAVKYYNAFASFVDAGTVAPADDGAQMVGKFVDFSYARFGGAYLGNYGVGNGGRRVIYDDGVNDCFIEKAT